MGGKHNSYVLQIFVVQSATSYATNKLKTKIMVLDMLEGLMERLLLIKLFTGYEDKFKYSYISKQ